MYIYKKEKTSIFIPVCMDRKSAAKNFASSLDEYVDVETSFNLGFGLFKSVRCVEIGLSVEAETESTLSACNLVEITWMSEISTLLGVGCDLIADII